MSKKIQHMILQKINNFNYPIDTYLSANSSTEIIDCASDFTVSVHKAEIPIKNIPLDIVDNNDPYVFYIFYKDLGTSYSNLIEGPNRFEIKGEYYSITEFLKRINDIIQTPEYNLGAFSLAGDFIEFKYSPNVDQRLGLELYFSDSLKYLIPMDHLYSETNTFSDSGHIFYYINQEELIPFGVPAIKQTTYSLKNFYNFKQIIVKSTLPTRSYKVYQDQSTIVTDSQILIDVSLNSENYNSNMNTWLLIPNSFRQFELVSPVAITDFMIWFEIKYANNKSYLLKMEPKQFASISLCFQRNIDSQNNEFI